MFGMDNYAAVRRFVFTEGHSRREAARVFGLSRETVLKMCRFSLPPGYTRTVPVTKPKLGALLPVIDTILEADRTGPVIARSGWFSARPSGTEDVYKIYAESLLGEEQLWQNQRDAQAIIDSLVPAIPR